MSEQLQLPTVSYAVGGYAFGEKLRRRFGVPAIHLGEDVVLDPGTAVNAIGAGKVVLAKTLPGSAVKKSWGGVIVLEHQHKKAQSRNMHKVQTNHKTQSTNHKHDVFYSIYGHLKDLQVMEGDTINGGQQIGAIAPALTAENGWWKLAHLHFAIYTGPLPARRAGGTGPVLPGWWRPEHFWRTKLSWWHAPQTFIDNYNKL